LLVIWRMGWVPGGDGTLAGLWVVVPMIASLLGFAHKHAKDEAAGFFRGFPSYWNIVALYAGLSAALLGEVGLWINGIALLALALMTVSPVWLIYPNLAPRRWKLPVLGGSYAWALLLICMLPWFPADVPGWLVLLSLIYPAFYLILSVGLRHRWPTEHEASTS
jgi:phosphatidylcholine synthase